MSDGERVRENYEVIAAALEVAEVVAQENRPDYVPRIQRALDMVRDILAGKRYG